MHQQHLTQPYPDRDLAYKIKLTVRGMAHWALSGPIGTHCKGCALFEMTRKARNEGYCKKYESMMDGYRITGLPASTPSCKYFEEKK